MCAILLLVPLSLAAHPCESCHPKEVAGYSHSSMARSLRRPAQGTGRRVHCRRFRHSIYDSLQRPRHLAAHGARGRGVGVPGRVCHRIGQTRRRISGPDRRSSVSVAALLLHESPGLRSGSGVRADFRTRFHAAGERGVRALSFRAAAARSRHGEPVHAAGVRGRGNLVRALPRQWPRSTCGGPCRVLSSTRQSWRRRPATVSASSAIWRG